MNVHIRSAIVDDCSAMFELVKELALYEKASAEVSISPEEFTRDGFGKSPVWQAFVAEFEGNIVGMALFYIRYSTWKGRRLYLEDLIVTETYRGHGIGKQLLDTSIAHAKTQNYSGVMWQVLDWNKPAIDFYKKYNTNFDCEWINVNINF